MELISPEFDPETGKWFYKGKEAKSIRDLLVKLGKNYQVEDYFPDGFTGNLTRRGKLFEGDKGHVAQQDSEQGTSNAQGVGSSPTVSAKPSLLETLERLGPITEEIGPIPDPTPEPVEEIPMIGEIKVDYSEPNQDEVDAANASCAEVFETDKYVPVNGHAHMIEPEAAPAPKPKRKHVKTGGAKGFCNPPDPNRDGILDMWAAGVITQQIATKFGVKNVKTIARRVAYWRTQGDPRAVVRNANSIGKKRPRAKKGIV